MRCLPPRRRSYRLKSTTAARIDTPPGAPSGPRMTALVAIRMTTLLLILIVSFMATGTATPPADRAAVEGVISAFAPAGDTALPTVTATKDTALTATFVTATLTAGDAPDRYTVTLALTPPPADGVAALLMSLTLPDGWEAVDAETACASSLLPADETPRSPPSAGTPTGAADPTDTPVTTPFSNLTPAAETAAETAGTATPTADITASPLSSGGLTLTHRAIDGQWDLLLDGAGNVPLPPGGTLLRLTVRAPTPPSPADTLCLAYACVYAYNKEETLLTSDLPAGQIPWSGFLDSAGDPPLGGDAPPTETVMETGANAGTEAGTEAGRDPSADPDPGQENGAVSMGKGGARYIGCRETYPKNGLFSVQFLFVAPAAEEGITAALPALTAYPVAGGGAPLRVSISPISPVSTVLSDSPVDPSGSPSGGPSGGLAGDPSGHDSGTDTLASPGGAAAPVSWYAIRFDGLSAARHYLFCVETGYADAPTVVVSYSEGRYSGAVDGGG